MSKSLPDLSPEAVEALASKNDSLRVYFNGPMGRDIAETSRTLRALSAALTAAAIRASASTDGDGGK